MGIVSVGLNAVAFGEGQVQVIGERRLPVRRSQLRADHLDELEVRVGAGPKGD